MSLRHNVHVRLLALLGSDIKPVDGERTMAAAEVCYAFRTGAFKEWSEGTIFNFPQPITIF